MGRLFLTLLVAIVFSAGLIFSGNALAADGAALYAKGCAACHGVKGEGKPKMGPAIAGNEFVKGGDDAAMVDVIRNGRMGAAKVYKDIPVPMMPQKKLTDDELKALIAYMRGLAG